MQKGQGSRFGGSQVRNQYEKSYEKQRVYRNACGNRGGIPVSFQRNRNAVSQL